MEFLTQGQKLLFPLKSASQYGQESVQLDYLMQYSKLLKNLPAILITIFLQQIILKISEFEPYFSWNSTLKL